LTDDDKQQNNKTRFSPKAILTAGLFVAVGIGSAGWFVKEGLMTFRMQDRVVSMKGLSERNVEADLSIWTLSHSGTSNDLPELQKTVEDHQNIILDYLKNVGFTADELSSQPLQAQDLLAQAYRPEGVERGRYIITQMITIRTANMNKIDAALSDLGQLLSQGVTLTNSMQPSYMFTKLNDVKPEMLAEAVENARESAQEFAAVSAQNIGRVKSARQGVFQILPRDPVNYASEQNQRYKKLRVVSTIDFFIENE